MLRRVNSYCAAAVEVVSSWLSKSRNGLVAGMRPLTLRALKQLSRERVKASCRKISISREIILATINRSNHDDTTNTTN
ncbi:hypothetical protein PLANPX_5794 [Lacipirellula parvula]|uniref:Uncharacterized protein n=1 Tax=Lacipirellula parvula TaxID=2650471 RepID=A0A5K7XJC1_9BACT|nr:hypothetical protein PLANPX_5794 [Lacipirellula parvula]